MILAFSNTEERVTNYHNHISILPNVNISGRITLSKNNFMKKLTLALSIFVYWTLSSLSTVSAQSLPDCSAPQIDGQPVYSARVQNIESPSKVQPGEVFDVQIVLLNDGNTTWYSDEPGCLGTVHSTRLGTFHRQDRESLFFAPGVFGKTNWLQNNRIKMTTPVVTPGNFGVFAFKMHAPENPGLYREYFLPLTEQKSWFKNSSMINMLIQVGDPVIDPKILAITQGLEMSINLADPKFVGSKKIKVDISEQTMKVYLGDQVLKNFRVSTGTYRTPTPIGKFAIQFKQEVRVAAKYPHYIMPKFMQFRKGGYGIHALPSLANDRGVFWREALNHIGTRRSHGCIRLLPEDANWVFQFTDVGTPMEVVY